MMANPAYRLLVLGFLLVVAAGVFGWMHADTSPRAAGIARGGEVATLSAPTQAAVAADIAVLAQRKPWGASAPPPSAQAVAPQAEAPSGNWRVAGIVGAGPERHVILVVQAQPNARHVLRYLPVGDRLPDGRVIERITGDTVYLRRGDQVSVFRLYSPTKPG